MSLLPAPERHPRLSIPLWIFGVPVALAAAIGVAYPSPESLLLLGVLLGLGILFAGAHAPLIGYMVLVASSVMIVVVSVGSGERNVMPFDVLLLPLVLGTWRRWVSRPRPLIDPTHAGHATLDRATRRFTDAAWLYVALAGASLLVTVGLGNAAGAFDSGLKLGRAVQGMLMFGIGMACVGDERSLGRVAGALVVGGLMFATINFAGFALAPITLDNTIRRAGMTWFVNEPDWSIADPNEAGIALLLLWVVLTAWQIHRPRLLGWAMMGLTLVLMLLTQSRSGLLAWLTFCLLTWKLLPRRALVLGSIGVAIVAPFVASTWWERMARTVSAERGSFEVYTTMVRVYGWVAAGRMIADHPVIGVGYLGFRHFSDQYNDLGIVIGTCENIFLEVATGMGIVGLLVFLIALWRTAALGDAVAKHARPGSMAATMARLHKPYLIALAVSNLTCDNWVGLVGLAQTAIWCAMLLRAGHLAIDAEARS